jgi:SAM-dependent methyltransferase
MTLKNYYEKYWESYWVKKPNELPTSFKKIIKKYKLLNNANEKVVLDVGCGNGQNYSKFIIPLVNEYYGLDLSQGAIDQFKSFGGNGTAHNVEEPFPFPENTFDLVFWIENAEHLFDPLSTLTHIKKALKPGGKVLIAVPNATNLWRRIELLFGFFNAAGAPETSVKYTYRDPHIRFFSKLSLKNFMKEGGFSTFKISTFGGSAILSGPPHIGRLFDWENKGIFWEMKYHIEKLYPSLLAGSFFVIAEKES